MEPEELFNYCEAGLWFVVAVILFLKSRRTEPMQRKLAGKTAAAFAVFAITDLIEAQTGAWWRPWWLFVLKAACVLVFVTAWWRYRRLGRKSPPSDRPN
ncbi:MAG: hypothetical protein HZA89_01075 [Verrucomicrobia bacterium]|nr:hypothetical protein [Verrucomicrobiota bacterium]